MRDKKAIDALIGEKLREVRTIKGLSLKELSHKIGCSYQQLQKYESGKNRLRARDFYKLSRVLGVEIDYFFMGVVANEQEPSVHNKNVPLQMDVWELFLLLGRLEKGQDIRPVIQHLKLGSSEALSCCDN